VFERELPPGKAALKDYEFKLPKDPLLAETNTVDPIGKKFGYEVYDYPGEYEDTAEGQGLVALRLEGEEAASHSIHARSDLTAFCAGYRFKLRNHYRPDYNDEYVLTEVEHSLDVGPGYGDRGLSYENQLSCIPLQVPFRPLRTTPKPLVQGLQTAVVVGPAGEEIYSDEFGRVKVQFFWDRYGKFDEHSSCWIRCSQGWAGKMWGGVYLPRIGQEVLVEFVEGDPDRPLITGRVYNAELMPPYELPRHQTISTIQSRSSPGGSPDNFNEIRFEDEKGVEQLFVHAEFDMDERVKHDYRAIVQRNRHRIVEGSEYVEVKGSRHNTIGAEQREDVSASKHLKVGQNLQEKVGMNWALDSGMEIHLKAGMKVVIEAGVQLHLKVGGNHIDISPAGVTIQGTLVRINSGPSPGQGSGANPEKPEKPDTADDGSARTKL
jgi:type VI secretion system secreted protein VgrG